MPLNPRHHKLCNYSEHQHNHSHQEKDALPSPQSLSYGQVLTAPGDWWLGDEKYDRVFLSFLINDEVRDVKIIHLSELVTRELFLSQARGACRVEE